jgi:hypothetical protein
LPVKVLGFSFSGSVRDFFFWGGQGIRASKSRIMGTL